MKLSRVAIVLGVINLALLAFVYMEARSVEERAASGRVLRGEELELVDSDGTVRASFKVSEGQSIFRLIDEDGTIRVKLGADRKGSGLVLLDENTEPSIQLRGDDRLIKLRAEDGKERVIEP